MKRSVVLPLTAIAACGLSWLALAAPSDAPPPSPMERMQRWTQNHEALLTAKLAGLKAGLKLTPDQEKLWDPFESAVRAAAEMRAERMKTWMEDREKGASEGERMSPVERLDRLATRLSEGGASLKKIADAANPLYASLDDTQKQVFGFLSHELMMMGHPRMMGEMRRHEAWMGPHHGPHGPEMGGPGGPGPHDDMGPHHHGDPGEDGPDEE